MCSCPVTELQAKTRLPPAGTIGAREFGLMMERSSDAAILTALDGRILHVNRAFEDITGYPRAEAVGRTPALLKSGQQLPEFYESLWKTLRAGRQFTGVIINRRKTGELFHEEKSIWPLINAHGAVTHYVSTGRDVSRRVAGLEHLVHTATHDCLTDLPNRALFMDRLEQALLHARRSGERLLVALLDVDRFKTVNDSLGHQAGDELLRKIAARLRASVRAEDTVARLGGDEFAMVLPGVINAEGAERILAKIIESFTPPIAVGQFLLQSSVSLGACLWAGSACEQGALLAQADQALYRVKRDGGNGFLVNVAQREPVEDFERWQMFGPEKLPAIRRDLHPLRHPALSDGATLRAFSVRRGDGPVTPAN